MMNLGERGQKSVWSPWPPASSREKHLTLPILGHCSAWVPNPKARVWPQFAGCTASPSAGNWLGVWALTSSLLERRLESARAAAASAFSSVYLRTRPGELQSPITLEKVSSERFQGFSLKRWDTVWVLDFPSSLKFSQIKLWMVFRWREHCSRTVNCMVI